MRLPQVTFGKVLAGTAVVLVVTTGTAYAHGMVNSADIVNGSVKSVDVGNGTIRSADVLNGGIKSADVLDESLTAADLAPGSVGQAEIQTNGVAETEIADNSIDGGEIINGSLGAIDLKTITTRSAVSAPIPGGGNGAVTASCLANEEVISGGNDGFNDVYVVASRKVANGWAVVAHNAGGSNRQITAHVYCLAP